VRSTRSLSWIERLLGFQPVPPPPHVFSLGPTELHYAYIQRGPQGLVLEDERLVELPAETFQPGVLGGPLKDARAFFEAIGGLVGRLPKKPEQASLVLPDTWLRLTFTEVAELPRKADLRDDILRFKLKRLVPFRVEDLRVKAVEVTPFPDQAEPLRVLLGFAIEPLVAQIENAFGAAGVQLGNITNTTLATIAAVSPLLGDGELAALLLVHSDAYTLCYFRDGEPLVYRYKAFSDGGVDQDSVARDLRMTHSFIRRHFAAAGVARAFFVAPPGQEGQWAEWIGDDLGMPLEQLAYGHFSLLRARPATSWLAMAPLVGAATLEVVR
jgi:type IV pilus assembly protein PilM